jgi:hypothetical protein
VIRQLAFWGFLLGFGTTSLASEIEVYDQAPIAGVVSPFMDKDGNALNAIPVKIKQKSINEVELEVPPEATDSRMAFTLSARLNTPQILSASFGVVFGKFHCHGPSYWDFCTLEGILIQIEPGLGGGKLSAGIAQLYYDPSQPQDSLLGTPIVGLDLKASILNTWGAVFMANPEQAFLGGEVDVTVGFVKFSFGVLGRIFGSQPDQGWIFTSGIGAGF